MFSSCRLTAPALVTLLLFAGSGAKAGIEPAPFSEPMRSVGPDPATFWMLFDAHTQSPGHPMLADYSNPLAPTFQVEHDGDGLFYLEFAIQNATYPFTGFQARPNGRNLDLLAFGGRDLRYTATFAFESAGKSLHAGAPVTFDSRPQPPGIPGVLMTFYLSSPARAEVAARGPVTMTMGLRDAAGAPMALLPATAPVPEPSTLLLCSLGLAGAALGWMRRRARR